MKSAVEKNQWDRQEREPDVAAEPALHVADRQDRQLLSHPEQGREDENAERDRAEDQPERSAPDGGMLEWLFAKEPEPRRHPQRIKLREVKDPRGRARREDENRPRDMRRPIDSHAFTSFS